MKSYIILTVLAVFILTGCSSTKKTSEYDDVYYSTRAEKKQSEADNMKTADPDYYVQSENSTTDYYMEDYNAGEHVSYEDEPYYSESETVQDPDGTTYITNNYYGSEGYSDYYDYSYSARINRFYNPYAGFNYYSPCYVGFYYDPWYNPYWYRPSLYFSVGWGWGGYGYGYPYYGYPYNNYWYGYNNGYYNGYWDGYYGSNDYGNSSYYYGPRTSGGSNNSPSGSRGTSADYAQKSTQTYTDRNRPLLSNGVVARPVSSSGTGSRNDDATVVAAGRSGLGTNQMGSKPPVTEVSGRSSGSALAAGSASTLDASRQDRQTVSKKSPQDTKPRYTYKKPTTQSNTASRYQPGENISTRPRTQPTKQYSKPENYNAIRNTAKASNQNAIRNTSKASNQNTAQRSALYSNPKSGSNKSYSQPSQTSRSKQYAQPSRSNTKSYSQPSRSSNSFSSPSSSGNSRSSYSRPSSSGSRSSSGARSISSPSRSGGSSSGGGRSSSSGSGGRRK